MDEGFEEDYDKTYRKHIETIQKRKQKDSAPEMTATPEAAAPLQEAISPPETTQPATAING